MFYGATMHVTAHQEKVQVKKNFKKIIIIFSVQKEKYCYFFLNNSETTMLFIVKTESHPHKGVACSVQGQLPNGKNMIWVWDHVLGRMMINGVNGSYRVGHRVLGQVALQGSTLNWWSPKTFLGNYDAVQPHMGEGCGEETLRCQRNDRPICY